ncbi:MAG: TSUP family transporter [Elusimicrobiota bacterium]|jgi:hypothetical protein
MTGFDEARWSLLGAFMFLSGVVDSLAGGGGLITLPAYLAMGLNPALLLGTNKLSSCIGTTVSMGLYSRSLRLNVRQMLPACAASVLGAALGAKTALRLDPSWIRWLLLAALPPIAIAVLARGRAQEDDSGAAAPRPVLRRRTALISLPIGLYDGFFGPGTGIFLALGFNRFCRFSLLRSTAWAKAVNWSSNVTALCAFLAAGAADLRLGLVMGGISAAGHFTGSHLGLRRGAKIIRPVIAVVCTGLFLKILRDVLHN